MSLNTTLVSAVEPIVPTVRPDLYQPAPGENLDEWCTYNRAESPRLHAGGAPRRIVYLYQLHYYLPLGRSPEAVLDALKKTVFTAGFTFPSAQDASDGDGQHWVLEFEGAEAVDYGRV